MEAKHFVTHGGLEVYNPDLSCREWMSEPMHASSLTEERIDEQPGDTWDKMCVIVDGMQN